MSQDFDVVDLGPTDHPTTGDEAPDFERPLVGAEYWADTALSELTDEGPVILLCHPMDGAAPTTYLWNEVGARDWSEYDLSIVGLSISDPYTHRRLIDERDIDHRLFSDPSNRVAVQYDVVNDLDGMAGVTEPRPAVFGIDRDRTVTFAWVAQEWPAYPDFDAVESAIEDLTL